MYRVSKQAVRKLRADVRSFSRIRTEDLNDGSKELQDARVKDAAYNRAVASGVDPDVADCFFNRA